MAQHRTRAAWLTRVLLGVVLILGLLGMHEISVTGSPMNTASMSTASMDNVAMTMSVGHDAGAPMQHHDGDMMSHLCLAVLDAALMLLGLLLLTGVLAVPRSLGATHGARIPLRRYRPPRPGGRALLNLVCVQRT